MENLSLLFHSFFLIILNLFSAAYSIPCLIFNSNICLESRQFYKKGHFLQKQYNVYADRYSHLDRERLPSSPYPAAKNRPTNLRLVELSATSFFLQIQTVTGFYPRPKQQSTGLLSPLCGGDGLFDSPIQRQKNTPPTYGWSNYRQPRSFCKSRL